MAAHPPPLKPGTLRAAFEGTYGNATWVNVMHFVLGESGAFGMSDVNTLVDQLAAKYAAKFHSSDIVNGSHFGVCKAVYRDLDDASTFRTVRVVDYNGSVGAAGAPAQVCYLINWNSDDGRRGGKPRNYLCGVPSSVIENDTDVNAAVAAQLSTLANGFLGEVGGLGTANLEILRMVSYSQRNAKTWRDTAAWFEIFNGTCSNVVATQRDRVDRRR